MMLTHQIVAIGDLHLQSTHPRNTARLAALDQIIAMGLECRLSAWLVLGDVFHGRSTVDDRNALAARLQAMADKAPVVVCYGNHELPGDLDVYRRLEARWPIYVVDRPEVITVDLATDGTAEIFVLPYPSKAGLLAAGTTADETLQVGHQALEAIFRDAGAKLAVAEYAEHVTLMMGHINIAGALSSSGQPQIGKEIEIDRGLLALLGPCPKILGHIHKPQQFEAEHAWYAGSVARLDWGEIEEKRCLSIDFSPNGTAGAWDFDVSSHKLPVAPMYRVEGELTRDGFTWHSLDGDHDLTWAGAEVRVRYRFPASERNVLNHASVRIPFEAALRLEVEPVAVPDRALRAPEVAAAHTLPAKVQAWADLSGATVTDGVLAKLALLEHGDPTQTLSAVANQVAALERAEKVEAAA